MNKLIYAMQSNDTVTDNGMLAHSTTSNANLDLFFKIGASRDMSDSEIISLFEAAYNENSVLAVRCLFYNRDIRGGQGERRSFRLIYNWICKNDPSLGIYLVQFVPQFGRFDDLFSAFDTDVEMYAAGFILQAIVDGNKLAAKWCPREGKSKDKIARKLMIYWGLTPRQYRKLLVGNTEVVENLMCKNDWYAIKYQSVPSKASSRYDEAFYKHDPVGYKEFLLNGAVKASAIFPVEVLKPMFGRTSEIRELRIHNQWDHLPNYVPENKNILPVCDVSGSMTWTESGGIKPIMVSIALGIYLAERNKGPFKDCFIPFSESAELVKFNSKSLRSKFAQLSNCNGWGSNTNFHAVFSLILDNAVRYNVPVEDMPTDLIIFSDMQFDPTDRQENSLKMIKRRYEQAGYKLPRIIYWNLNSYDNVPAKFDDRGVALVSGYSPSVLMSLFDVNIPEEKKSELTPLDMMFTTLNSERYSVITF